MNPQPIESRDIANNAGYQDDPVLGSEGVVIPRVAVVAGSTGLVDSAGNPLSSGQSLGASYNPIITGSYPVLLASWTGVTITSTQQSPAFDARPYQSIVAQIAVTAISGSTATVQLICETQEPGTGIWWNGSGLGAISSTSTVRIDGSISPSVGNITTLNSPQGRPAWPNSRITLLIVGGSTSVTLSAYVWGF